MKASRQTKSSSGFAVIETVLILVIVAAVIGVGGYVVKQNSNASSTLSSTVTTPSAKSFNSKNTAASLDRSLQLDSQSETNVDSSADGQTGANATSDDSAISNVGGAYDESTL